MSLSFLKVLSSWRQGLLLFSDVTTTHTMTPSSELQDHRRYSMPPILVYILLHVSSCHSEQFQPNSACTKSSWGACFILTINDGSEGQIVAGILGLLNAKTTVDTFYQDALETMPVGDRPRYSYVLTALSRIRGLFLGWDDAVSSSTTAFGIVVSAILSALDPGNQTSFADDDLYQALFLGLPFFLANNGIGIPLGSGLEDISGLLTNWSILPPSPFRIPPLLPVLQE